MKEEKGTESKEGPCSVHGREARQEKPRKWISKAFETFNLSLGGLCEEAYLGV